MVILDASRRGRHVPGLAKWSLGVGIVATVGANVAHGMNHDIVGIPLRCNHRQRRMDDRRQPTSE